MLEAFRNDPAYHVIQKLENAGFEAVFVGGAVRDTLLGRTPKDIDIATSAEPNEVKMVFSNTVDVGLAHGTVLVIEKGHPIEVTTYRTEGKYTDHRRPDHVNFVKTLKDDLFRRDFTMNALALTKDGELIDLFGGERDIQNKYIKAVGTPEDRFHEDALRMLRAIRFTSTLDFEIEARTKQAIHEIAPQIQHVSIERIKMEMDKLFIGKNPRKGLTELIQSGLSAYLPLFPREIYFNINALQFEKSIIGWAFLMICGEFTASQIASAYKLSNEEKQFLQSVMELYLIKQNRTYTINEIYQFELQVLQAVEIIHSILHKEPHLISKEELEKMKLSLPIQSIKDLTIDGRQLMDWTGKRGGPWTGEWMKKI